MEARPSAPARLVINDIPVEVRPNRRRRTRIGVVLDPAGFVVLDAPPNVSDAEVRAVINEHQRWLRYRLQALRKEGAGSGNPSSLLRYQDGELIHYLGQTLRLRIDPALIDSVVVQDRTLHVLTTDTTPAQVGEQIRLWYQERARESFAAVLEGFIDLPWLEGKLPPWGHRFMRSQWGSCSARGRLSLNTHLIKTPREQIEYVVLHELCHLRHHHHGAAFHRLVEAHMPDWRKRSDQLNRYLPVLMQE